MILRWLTTLDRNKCDWFAYVLKRFQQHLDQEAFDLGEGT